jgi:hypothetical protein
VQSCVLSVSASVSVSVAVAVICIFMILFRFLRVSCIYMWGFCICACVHVRVCCTRARARTCVCARVYGSVASPRAVHVAARRRDCPSTTNWTRRWSTCLRWSGCGSRRCVPGDRPPPPHTATRATATHRGARTSLDLLVRGATQLCRTARSLLPSSLPSASPLCTLCVVGVVQGVP